MNCASIAESNCPKAPSRSAPPHGQRRSARLKLFVAFCRLARSPKQRETRREHAQTGAVAVRELGSAGGLQQVIHVVPANRNRLSEGTAGPACAGGRLLAQWKVDRIPSGER